MKTKHRIQYNDVNDMRTYYIGRFVVASLNHLTNEFESFDESLTESELDEIYSDMVSNKEEILSIPSNEGIYNQYY